MVEADQMRRGGTSRVRNLLEDRVIILAKTRTRDTHAVKLAINGAKSAPVLLQ